MYRAPPEFIYVRWIGLLCTFIPMIAFIAINTAFKSPESLLLTLVTFIPLLILSYYLDYFMRAIPLPRSIKHPYLKVALSWLVAYPISRVLITEPILALIGYQTLVFVDVNTTIILLLLMMLLGFAYGTFFYTAYISIFRMYLKRKLKKGEVPSEFSK